MDGKPNPAAAVAPTVAPGSSSGRRPSPAISIRHLSAHLLASNEILGITSQWCHSRHLGNVAFERATGAVSQCMPDESLDEMGLAASESVSYFRIDLVSSGSRLATLDHWFIPQRLPEQHVLALAGARVPLRSCLPTGPFSSRCFYLRFFDDRASEQGSTLFEHHFVTCEVSTHRPVAISHNRYLRSLVGGQER